VILTEGTPSGLIPHRAAIRK